MKKLLLLLSLILGACASMPTAEEIANADYGAIMSQSTCESIVKEEMRNYLKDVGSAQYEFGQCSTNVASSVPLMGLPKQYGFAIPFRVNAKNSFGGYSGFKNFHFLLKNGRVIRKTRQDDEYGLMFPFK